MKHYTKNILAVFLIGFVLVACKTNKPADKGDDTIFYTCSMDPQVMEKKPGKCPICKMELTRIEVSREKSNTLRFSETQLELANIKVDTVRLSTMMDELNLTAKIVMDENQTTVISSRIMGRIDKLYFKSMGEHVNKGDLIYEIYSEELAATQKDYLIAKEKAEKISDNAIDYKQLFISVKSKLLLWGMSEKQLEQLSQSGQVPVSTPFYSPIDGFVTETIIKEGDYIAQGQTIYKTNTLSSVWVEAQAYPAEIVGLKPGQSIIITFDVLAGVMEKSKIDFISPELISQSKIGIVRARLDNSQHKYFPGMLTTISVETTQKETIVLPLDAVLQEAKGNIVWLQNAEGTFENRMVTIGSQNSKQIEILSGLEVGDKVVVSGAYLINSEYRLKKGANPMEDHDMKGMKM
jgi:Cu(I)/Ag(I) efflux system membrane fusion protein